MSPETKSKTVAWIEELIKTVGFPIVVCGVLLWFGHGIVVGDRQRIESDSVFIRETLTKKMTESTTALNSVTEAIEENTKTQQLVRRAIENNHGKLYD